MAVPFAVRKNPGRPAALDNLFFENTSTDDPYPPNRPHPFRRSISCIMAIMHEIEARRPGFHGDVSLQLTEVQRFGEFVFLVGQ
jgi:hypothetical protein